MKRIFIIMALLMAVTSSLSAAISLEEGQVWWGLFTEDMPTETIGQEKAYNYNCAIFIAGDDATAAGTTISAVRFPLAYRTSNMRSAKVWVAAQLPTEENGNAVIEEVSILDARLQGRTDANAAFNEVKLKQPVTIPKEGLYIGFSIKVRNAEKEWEKHPIMVGRPSGTDHRKGFFFYDAEEAEWQDRSADYVLALQVAVSGGSLPANAAEGAPFFDIFSSPSTTTTIGLPVRATGTQPVKSIDAQLEINGVAQGDIFHYDFTNPIANFATDTLHFEVVAPAQAGNADCRLRIDRVNGKENEATDKAVHSGNVAVLSQQGHRRTVMEEFTGSWCSWCPRGIVGIDLLSEAYPDRFVPIAIHRNDPMQVADYDVFYGDYDSFPGAFLNRDKHVDPYDGADGLSLNIIMENTLAQTCPADLEIKAEWTDDNKTELKLTTSTTFYYATPRADYALAFVVLHDSLKGDTPKWHQLNIYSGNTEWADRPGMKRFTDAPARLTDFAYNHVAIAAKDIIRGVNGSISAPIVSGEPQQYVTTINLADNSLLQNADNVHAAALLIYRPTGLIVTAATASAQKHVSGILVPQRLTPADAAIYSLDGRRQPSVNKGLYIIRTNDGRMQKIMKIRR